MLARALAGFWRNDDINVDSPAVDMCPQHVTRVLIDRDEN